VEVPPEVRQEIVCGTESVLCRMISLARQMSQAGCPYAVAVDGWYGVDWAGLQAGLRAEAKAQGLALEIVATAELYKPGQRLRRIGSHS